MKTKRFHRIIGLVLLLPLSGCSVHHPSIKPITPQSVVVAFGDSLTAGTGVTPDQAYPTILSKQLGCTVINEGIPGQTTSQGLERLPELISRLKPTLVILCYGGNDLLQDVPETTIRKNLGQMLDLLRAANCDVVLIGVPQAKPGLPKAGFYEAISKEHGLPCDNETLRKILSHENLKSDEIHPNAEGYRQFAEAIAELIQESTH